MLPHLTDYAKILYLLMVITGALCDKEDTFLQSTVSNKFIHITKTGKVLADDPLTREYPQTIIISDHRIAGQVKLKLTLYIKEAQRYICFKKNWRLVTSRKLHDYCYFYETMESGYHRFYSIMDEKNRKYIGFMRNGRPVRYDGRHPPDERTFNLFKWNETSFYEISPHRQKSRTMDNSATAGRHHHHPHTTSTTSTTTTSTTTTTTTTTRRPSAIDRKRHNRKKHNMQLIENRQRLYSPKNPADRRHHMYNAADVMSLASGGSSNSGSAGVNSIITTTEALVIPVHQQQQMDYVNDERARSEEFPATAVAIVKKPSAAIKKMGKDKPKLRHQHHKWHKRKRQPLAKEEKLAIDGQFKE